MNESPFKIDDSANPIAQAVNAVAVAESIQSKSPVAVKKPGSLLTQISKQKALPPSKSQLELLEEQLNSKNPNIMSEAEPTEQNPLKITPFNFWKGLAAIANKLFGFTAEVRESLGVSGENQALILKEVRELSPRAIQLEAMTARYNAACSQIGEQEAEIQLLKEQAQVLKDKIKKVVETEALFKIEQVYKDLVVTVASGKALGDVLQEKEEIVKKTIEELKVMLHDNEENKEIAA